VVVVEDLISTGSSSLKVVETLRETGCEVLGLVAIFSYGFDVSKNNFETANCKYTTLSDYSALMNTIQKEELFSEEDLKILAAWSEDPENWMVKEID
ncbi:MAG: orotate phosphoribosyltransferase, partial [Bacteroidetes bacterium]|nr:orotate phosphoribosyltransferase [Bacteroidota bacterium]